MGGTINLRLRGFLRPGRVLKGDARFRQASSTIPVDLMSTVDGCDQPQPMEAHG